MPSYVKLSLTDNNNLNGCTSAVHGTVNDCTSVAPSIICTKNTLTALIAVAPLSKGSDPGVLDTSHGVLHLTSQQDAGGSSVLVLPQNSIGRRRVVDGDTDIQGSCEVDQNGYNVMFEVLAWCLLKIGQSIQDIACLKKVHTTAHLWELTIIQAVIKHPSTIQKFISQ